MVPKLELVESYRDFFWYLFASRCSCCMLQLVYVGDQETLMTTQMSRNYTILTSI
jgi:hypothetical protein